MQKKQVGYDACACAYEVAVQHGSARVRVCDGGLRLRQITGGEDTHLVESEPIVWCQNYSEPVRPIWSEYINHYNAKLCGVRWRASMAPTMVLNSVYTNYK